MISRLANKKFIKSAIRIMGMAAAAVFVAWIAVAQPAFHGNHPSQATVDPAKLKEHVQKLSQEFYPRDWPHTTNLDKCADYIAKNFGNAGAAVESQAFTVRDKEYRNVIGRFGTKGRSKIIVGAHYDAYGNMPGADDNASGVAALIELAYLLGRQAPSNEVELVAYVLEEPPFFGTDSMGSAVHARSIAGCKADVRGVIVFEMVGYFSDTWGSQSYPALVFSLMYPSRANFIGVVGKWSHGDWVKTVKLGMKGATGLPVCSVRAPLAVPGIDLSDHLNYWPYGIKAIMVTDTAFYRNKAYHTPGDTFEKLDYNRMSQVVVAVFEAVRSL